VTEDGILRRERLSRDRYTFIIIFGAWSYLKGLKLMSRRDYDEGYEDARREMEERELGSSRRGGGDFTAAMLIKYLAIIVVVIIVAYVVLQILGVIQGAFYRVP